MSVVGLRGNMQTSDCSALQEEVKAKTSLRSQVIHLAQRLRLESHEQYSWPPSAPPAGTQAFRAADADTYGAARARRDDADEMEWALSPHSRQSPIEQICDSDAYKQIVADHRQHAVAMASEGTTQDMQHNLAHASELPGFALQFGLDCGRVLLQRHCLQPAVTVVSAWMCFDGTLCARSRQCARRHEPSTRH
jgi:hypothetical protein